MKEGGVPKEVGGGLVKTEGGVPPEPAPPQPMSQPRHERMSGDAAMEIGKYFFIYIYIYFFRGGGYLILFQPRNEKNDIVNFGKNRVGKVK